MKKKMVFLLISFFSMTMLFSEIFEISVNKDTNYFDAVDTRLEKVKKGTLIKVDSDNAELTRYNSDAEGKDAQLFIFDKALYLRDIIVNNNSECLPEDVTGATYTMNYYLSDIFNKESQKKLFEHEPYLFSFLNNEIRNDGESYRDYYFPYSIKFYYNFYIEDDVFYSPYSRNPMFVKNIEKTDDGFLFYIIPLTYSKNILPIYDRIIERKKINQLKFQFDGDYLYIYKDNKLVFELVKTNEDTLFQIRNYYLEQRYNVSKITWPRHADGSCDYEIKNISKPK